MTEILTSLTMLCLLVPVYVYFGYPVLLWTLTLWRPRRTHRVGLIEPSVSLIVSCYNEAGVIREKLDNASALDYPSEKLEIIVVSDGSDDGTDDIVKEYAAQGVRLIRQEGRLGKTMGLNLALEAATGEIVVFSDANAMYAADALRMLVRNFADEGVGYVVGAALYTDGREGASAQNENLYWRYELAIKSMESRLHSVVGGDGAIYAIRRELWEPLQQRDINDFVNPLQIVAKGYRGIFEPEAKCFEETAGSFDKEIARKERIVNRSIRGLMRVKSVMNPLTVGIFAVEVISHKLLRWLIPLFLLVGVGGSTLLAARALWPFQVITAGALVLTVLAFQGQRAGDKQDLPVWISVPYYFVMVNLYAVKGIAKAARGETQVTWSSARPVSHGGLMIDNNGSRESVNRWWLLLILFFVLGLGIGYVC
ncbi:glycosyltransferase family 2 protein [Mangrovitalea sediminis]|uniref:glycosyltransferase family 2 protein n=1 Tax=Mangrovitalea sediminis TaxID=1982043 RepID=UPI000BE51CE8|nr:glycosyltransferase family 2 protein [Mangrovitalea sediminis]